MTAGGGVVADEAGGGGGGIGTRARSPSEEITPGGTKKTTRKLPVEKSSFDSMGRRLVEYFVVVSSVEWNHHNEQQNKKNGGDKNNKGGVSDPEEFSEWKMQASNHDDDDDDEYGGYHFRPTITARYPLHDHHDNPLHENVMFFCHPSGRIVLRQQEYMPKVHYFVATGGTGKQIYGTCLTLWEPYELKMVHSKDKKKKSNKPSSTKSTSSSTTNPFEDDSNDNKETATEGRTLNADGDEVEMRQVFIPKCLVILSTYPYLAAFREYLTQLNRLTKLGTMTLPVERYITNFCSELPAPPPGSFEVQTTILDSVIKIWSPPDNLPIAWVSLPFAVLFECLDIDNIILVWHCLALERQVLVTSTQLSLLTQCLEIFLSLLFPMRWSHAYIPVLPHFLIPILSAPMPFLCGINKAILADALYDLSRDCVLVDLDKNTVTLGPDTLALPSLPPYQESVLRAQLDSNVGMIFREARSLTKNDDYSDSGTHLPNHVKLMAEAMWESKLCLFDEAFHLVFTPDEARKCHLNGDDASGLEVSDREMRAGSSSLSSSISGGAGSSQRKQSQWDAVQEAFLDTFVYLLRNYRKYLVFPSKANEGSYGGAGFRSKEFIESQRFDMRDFLEQFIGTQMFDNFITKRLYGSGEADVAFFDMAVDKFLKNAGMFSDVDLSGRLLDAAGNITNKTQDIKRLRGPKALLQRRNLINNIRPNASSILAKKNEIEPLLQSARVHRKLKTIVPPEPSGEGLPPLPILMDNPDLQIITVGGGDTDDASSVGSRSRSGLSTLSNASGKQSVGAGSAAAGGTRGTRIIESASKSEAKYKYPSFPSEFNTELFGTPRPLPSAVIAEFDRQRKDAAQFRRKAPRKQNEGGPKRHFHRAHATTDPIIPPSPEVATFTVFFMAFTAMVGKDLVDLAHLRNESDATERTILSTYVPTSEFDIDSEIEGALNSAADDDEQEGADIVDPEEKARVEEMKANRPNMGGMFGDEEYEEIVNTDNEGARGSDTRTVDQEKNTEEKKIASPVASAVPSPVSKSMNGASTRPTAVSPDERSTKSGVSFESKPRERFRDKLSDLQIQEAQALGRAQLGLAFEMLTMMKKRGLKADPEAYQCLIDACGRVGDTKRATDLLAKMHEDGIVADGTVYACLVSAFSADTAWKDGAPKEDLPEWANSTAVEMDWNKLQKRSLLDRIVSQVVDLDDDDEEDTEENVSAYRKLRNRLARRNKPESSKSLGVQRQKSQDDTMEFFVTEAVERQISLGENLLEIVFPDISIDTENEVCPRCNFVLSDDHVVQGWKPDSNEYTTACPNCTQRFVPHFCVQCSSPAFIGSKGAASPLMCERLSPWVLQKEIRSVMSEREGCDNLLSPQWREKEYKNAVLWWNLVLSCMRYRFPFSFLLQGSFEQNLIAPMPEDES